MKRVLLFLLFLFQVLVLSAQIEEFSDEMLNKYTEKQEAILSQPLNFDKLFPSYQIEELPALSADNYFRPQKYSFLSDEERAINHLGRHFYKYKDTPGFYALKVSPQYERFTLTEIPKGKYEVVGMLFTKSDLEYELSLLKGTDIIWEDGDVTVDNKFGISTFAIKQKSRPELLEEYIQELSLKCDYSGEDINRWLHNGHIVAINRVVFKVKDEYGNFFYLFDCERHNKDVVSNSYYKKHLPIEPFKDWLLYEQFEYFKKILSENEWVYDLGDKEQITITDSKELEYTFNSPVNVSFKQLFYKDNHYIAIFGIQNDSITVAKSIYYKVSDISIYDVYNEVRDDGEWDIEEELSTDTLHVAYFNFDTERLGQGFRIIRKADRDNLKKMKAYLENLLQEKNREKILRTNEERQIEQEKYRKAIEERKEQKKAKAQQIVQTYGKKFGIYINRHQVCVGMSREMCILAWGRPRNIIKHASANYEEEILSYGSNNYLIIRNNVLVETVTSK